MTSTYVKPHYRKRSEKPREYIETNMALMSRRADAILFAQRHGVMVISDDDVRLKTPLPEPAIGGRFSMAQIVSQLKQLAGWRR